MRPTRVSKTLPMIFLLLGSLVSLTIPEASATPEFSEDTDVDFSQGVLHYTEILGSGPSAKVALQKNNTMWMLMNGTNAPSAREGAAMCFVPDLGETMLFGGYNGTYLNDTWTYNFTRDEWTPLYLSPTPSPRERAGMVCDPDSNLVILHGGWDGSPLDDTWEFNPITLTWTERTVLTKPGPMDSNPLSYDSGAKKVLMIGNSTVTGQMETWAFDAPSNQWTNRNPVSSPTTRKGHAMAYYPTKGRTVLFGGLGASGALDDTWEYNYVTNTWFSCGSGGPSARYDHLLFYHPEWDAVYAYAGRGPGVVYSDMYEYDGSIWSPVSMLGFPQHRYAHAATFDSENGYVIMCCGSNASSPQNDTWSLGDWYQPQGFYRSRVWDTGSANVNYTALYMNQSAGTFSESTDIRIQIAASVSPLGPWIFTGPDGTESSWFNTSGVSLGNQYDNNRYVRYEATFISWRGRYTPLLENLTICVCGCPGPHIISTDPEHASVGIDLNATIVIGFSEQMNASSVTWDIYYLAPKTLTGLVFAPSWHGGDTTLWLNHSDPFQGSMVVQVWINGTDLDGMPLDNSLGVSNPFIFATASDLCAFMSETYPEDGAVNVSLDAPIIANFTTPVDVGTFLWNISPDPGDWTIAWSNMDSTVTLTHGNLFEPCQVYIVSIDDARDKTGAPIDLHMVPNPWSFTTICVPWVVDTYPPDGGTDIPFDAPLIINFSEPMSTATVSIDVDPDPGGWGPKEWGNSDMTLWWNHSGNYPTWDTITVTIQSGQNKVGLDLVPLPYVWSFKTYSQNPFITWTDPYDGETGVDINRTIQIEFSNPMNTSSLVWIISPDPGDWTENWFASDTLVVLNHSVDFLYVQIYTVQVTSAKDKNGFDLTIFAWQFRTEDRCCPDVNRTDPENGEMGVDPAKSVLIQFTREIVPATFHWNITLGPDPGGWSESWSKNVESNDTVLLNHSNLFESPASICLRVEHAKDIYGMDLGAPYDFCFATAADPPRPRSLSVYKTSASIRLAWNLAGDSTHYNIYDSVDRYTPFPIGWSFNQVPSSINSFDFDHLEDGQTHYYIVRAYNSATFLESTNSTMGVKIDKAFTVSPIQMNIYWMSLPYISEYATASDIATELTDTNVNVIAKWDRASQEVVSYYYARGKWRGRDFAIASGDGIYVSAVADFDWVIVGTDSDIIIDLPYDLQPFKHNKHYISVPYTGVYTHASDIVWDIEGGLGVGRNTCIIEVGLWDPATQSERVYSYTPSGWAGDNFVISPGDGVYLRMVQTYIWQPVLVTPYVP